MAVDKSANPRSSFAAPENSVTRERIFFNRLCFDLKIAAAREGYHLHVYEPDVYRDGFDVLAQDDESGRVWLQTGRPPAKTARQEAADVVNLLRTASRGEKLALSKRLFVTA